MAAPETTDRIARRRAGLGGELALAFFPTITVLAVLLLLERFGGQRLLFASLASSAFLVYLDPRHPTNRIRTLVVSQAAAALVGTTSFAILGPGYVAAGVAMVVTIFLMVVLDVVHPPAVSTALGFAFRSGPESNLTLFGFAVGLVVVLVGLQRVSLWILARVGKALASEGEADGRVAPG